MKWVVASMNVSAVSRALRTVRSMSRLFAVLSVAALLFLFVTGLIGLAQIRWSSSSLSPMKSAASTLSSSFFMDMLAMEMPQLQSSGKGSTFSPKNTAVFLVRYLTGVHPTDPKSYLAAEMPGLRIERSALLYSAQATQDTDYPADFTPPPDAFKQAAGQGGTVPGQANGSQSPAPASDTAVREPRVFIYHSHNRESFIPELKSKGITDPDLAYDTDINITLVGNRLKEKIEAQGVPALLSKADYPSEIKGFNYAKSYAYSASTVKEAMAQHGKLDMIFDLHRDALARNKTTVTINGKDYAQVYFIVGKKNPNWEQNLEFANKLHSLLEQKMPGISRGIYGKASQGNGEYNQSLFANSMLLEIGGPYNTLEEMYRTADLLGEIVGEALRDTVKANAPVPTARAR